MVETKESVAVAVVIAGVSPSIPECQKVIAGFLDISDCFLCLRSVNLLFTVNAWLNVQGIKIIMRTLVLAAWG